MGFIDRLRSAGWKAIAAGDGAIAAKARSLNDALGRPLASDEELADRKAFEAGYTTARPQAAAPAAAPASGPSATEPAPVVIYFLDKQRRDVPRITEVLEQHKVPYKTMSLEEDPAAQMAIRRDSGGHRLPVVFIAGDCVGGRTEIVNLAASGALKKKVFGA